MKLPLQKRSSGAEITRVSAAESEKKIKRKRDSKTLKLRKLIAWREIAGEKTCSGWV